MCHAVPTNIAIPPELGALPLRNAVLFPHAVMPVSITRRKALNLLDDYARDSDLIVVVTQKNPAHDDPGPSDLFRTGCVARILKTVKLRQTHVCLIVQGLKRARVAEFVQEEPFQVAAVALQDDVIDQTDEIDAMADTILGQFEILLAPHITDEVHAMVTASGHGDPGRLSDLVAAFLETPVEEKIDLLECDNVKSRMRRLIEIMTREIKKARN